MNKRMDKDNTEYQEIEIQGLATSLAEEAWRNETRNEKTETLYENGEVKGFWATQFFGLRDAYLELIKTFKKKKDVEL